MVAGGTPDLNAHVGVGAGIAIEAVATTLLVLVVFGTAVDERAPAGVFPLAIGLAVALDIMAFRAAERRRDEPGARLRPGLASGHWAHHPVF